MSDALLRALEEIGYQTPTPIQSQAVPHLLAGKDLLGIAQTGTGKTAAFALPLLQQLASEPGRPVANHPRALVLAPTRELALQIGEELDGYGRHLKLSHAVIFGGVGQQPQIDRLRRGIDVLVATPGRLLDLIGQRHANLSKVEILVLDEADRLLDMGFIRDVQRLVRQTPKTRQSLLFSATMPKEVASLAAEMLDHPVRVDVSPKEVTVKKIKQRMIRVDNADKRWVLEHLLREESVSRAIVFTRTKHGANKVAKHLVEAGITAEAIHGNKSQSARQRALGNFKDGTTWVLVATDIAARGIDVQGISHVINYELPNEPESYVHRIGRTARAGAGGVAWSLCDQSELKHLRGIERLVGRIPDEATVALGERPAERKPAAHRAPEPVRSQSAGQRGGSRQGGGSQGGGGSPRRRVRGGGQGSTASAGQGAQRGRGSRSGGGQGRGAGRNASAGRARRSG
ncbi:MAG: DEAD/DEAH box helicase [Pseudomonadales bacterium]